MFGFGFQRKKRVRPFLWAKLELMNNKPTLPKLVYMIGDKPTGEEELFIEERAKQLIERGVPVIIPKNMPRMPKWFTFFSRITWHRNIVD